VPPNGHPRAGGAWIGNLSGVADHQAALTSRCCAAYSPNVSRCGEAAARLWPIRRHLVAAWWKVWLCPPLAASVWGGRWCANGRPEVWSRPLVKRWSKPGLLKAVRHRLHGLLRGGDCRSCQPTLPRCSAERGPPSTGSGARGSPGLRLVDAARDGPIKLCGLQGLNGPVFSRGSLRHLDKGRKPRFAPVSSTLSRQLQAANGAKKDQKTVRLHQTLLCMKREDYLRKYSRQEGIENRHPVGCKNAAAKRNKADSKKYEFLNHIHYPDSIV